MQPSPSAQQILGPKHWPLSPGPHAMHWKPRSEQMLHNTLHFIMCGVFGTYKLRTEVSLKEKLLSVSSSNFVKSCKEINNILQKFFFSYTGTYCNILKALVLFGLLKYF